MTGFTRIVTHAGPFHCDEVSSQSEASIVTVDQSESSIMTVDQSVASIMTVDQSESSIS